MRPRRSTRTFPNGHRSFWRVARPGKTVWTPYVSFTGACSLVFVLAGIGFRARKCSHFAPPNEFFADSERLSTDLHPESGYLRAFHAAQYPSRFLCLGLQRDDTRLRSKGTISRRNSVR